VLAAGGLASVADLLSALGATLERRSRAKGSLLVEAIVAARRDPDVAAALVAGIGERQSVFTELLHQAQLAGDIDPAVSPEVISRFCLMVGLGSLLLRALDLPPTADDEWSSFIARLVDSFRTKENQP